MTTSQDQPQRCDPHFEMFDLWTDPDKSVTEILRGTVALIPAVLGLVPKADDDREEISFCHYKARITLYVDNDSNSSQGNGNDQPSVSYREYWSNEGMDGSASSINGPSGVASRIANRPVKPAWIATEIPSPPNRGKNQDAGGERTEERGRPIGKIEVFQVNQLPLNLDGGLSRLNLSNDSQKNSKEQHEHMLQCLATRLGRIVSNRWVVEKQQEDLNILQDKVRRLVESQDLARIGQWELDLTNNALRWSPGVFDIFRVDRKRFGASYEAFLDAIHPDDRKFVDDSYTNSLKTKKPYNIVHRLLFRNEGTDEKHEIRWVNEICRTEYHPKTGQPLYSVGIVQDITELKEAQEMDRLKTAFLANMR